MDTSSTAFGIASWYIFKNFISIKISQRNKNLLEIHIALHNILKPELHFYITENTMLFY